MTKLCLECTKRYNIYIYIKISPGEHAPDLPSWAWLRHAGTPPAPKINLWTRPYRTFVWAITLVPAVTLIPC